MSLTSDINTTSTALSNIKSAIIAKGVTPSGNITTYANAISQIPSGSSGSSGVNYAITTKGHVITIGASIAADKFSTTANISDNIINAASGNYIPPKITAITAPFVGSTNEYIIEIHCDAIEEVQQNSSFENFSGFTGLQQLYFASLNPNSFGTSIRQFANMLSGINGCTVHFPASIQSIIGAWTDVINGFGGTNTVVLFDL